MRNTSFTLILLFSNLFTFGQTNNSFYYSFDNVIHLNAVTNSFTAEFTGEADTTYLISKNLQFKQLEPNLFHLNGTLDSLLNIGQGVYELNQVYETDSGAHLYMKNEIVLQWKDQTDQSEINSLITQYGLAETKVTRLYTTYHVNIPLLVSQLIYETDLVKYCHPVFLAEVEHHDYIPNDEYFGNQWHLHNTGQEVNDGLFGTVDTDIDAPEAWDITFGSSDVVIAVIDDGLISDHPDLPNTRQIRLPGSNFATEDGLPTNDPSPVDDQNHGNKCAGIIAAEIDNNEGVVGVAPHSTIMPIKVKFSSETSFLMLADAISFATDNGANIISNSWGFTNSINLPNLSAPIVSAIEDAIDQGVVVIFSAGNTAHHFYGQEGGVNFPANADILSLITVGASDRNDSQTNYSPTDTELDIVAPSHTAYHFPLTGESFNIWTIDRLNGNGDNPWNQIYTGPLPIGIDPLPEIGEEIPNQGTNYLSYSGRMGGTSAAAPIVAGVVALMKSVNPCLSVSQINDILKNTAEKVGGYDYNGNATDPGHSLEMGHGRVNAHLAVLAAQALNSSEVDLYTKDTPEDFGAEPNTASELLYVSEDIWVRNQADGLENQVHENPEYTPNEPVYVYVRVRNKSCEASLGNEQLNLYWAKASTALTWPQYWDGSITDPTLMGNQIGVQNIPIILAGDEDVMEFPWFPPNPADYEDINEQPWHFCLLSRIVASNDPMNNEIFNQDWNLGYNVGNNNNIAWKNVSVVDVIPGIVGGIWDDDKIVGATIAVGNAGQNQETFKLDFKVPQYLFGDPITKTAEVRITLDDKTWQKWANGGYSEQNIEISREDRNQLIVKKANARLGNLTYNSNERSLINLSFNFLTREISDKYQFEYHVIQRRATGQFLGGEKFIVTFPPRETFVANAGPDTEVLMNDSIELSASEINEPAIFNWYDSDKDLLHTGRTFYISPGYTQNYHLEVIARSDGFKDYDKVEVRVNRGVIVSVSPNPASSSVTVQYDIPNAFQAHLMLTSTNNGHTDSFTLDTNSHSNVIDVSSYSFGVYGITLVVDGEMVDQKGLVIE